MGTLSFSHGPTTRVERVYFKGCGCRLWFVLFHVSVGPTTRHVRGVRILCGYCTESSLNGRVPVDPTHEQMVQIRDVRLNSKNREAKSLTLRLDTVDSRRFAVISRLTTRFPTAGRTSLFYRNNKRWWGSKERSSGSCVRIPKWLKLGIMK